MEQRCFNCGEVTQDWDYVGHVKVYVCGARECQRELADENRGMREEAAFDAMRDDYERYW